MNIKSLLRFESLWLKAVVTLWAPQTSAPQRVSPVTWSGRQDGPCAIDCFWGWSQLLASQQLNDLSLARIPAQWQEMSEARIVGSKSQACTIHQQPQLSLAQALFSEFWHVESERVTQTCRKCWESTRSFRWRRHQQLWQNPMADFLKTSLFI